MNAASCILLLFLPLSSVGIEMESRENRFSKCFDDDVTYDDHLLWSLAVSSRGECAVRCMGTEDCDTFTFTKGSPSGTCRLHFEVMPTLCPRSIATGSATYTMRQEPGPEPGSGPPTMHACTNHFDCATCIGFECFLACGESDLQQDYMKYPKSGIIGGNIAEHPSRTVDECKALCNANTECLTFEFYIPSGSCNLQNVTNLDVDPSKWERGIVPDWDLYQKMCA
ncbi:hypothetical protein BaRGS_00023629 [Batillaria attramentaria]|uniref:Apple domain-containing protein n=1 Tax=Batillaria attramentaria TaxID=370345 RepID=A0ABD0KD42_9CAEN